MISLGKNEMTVLNCPLCKDKMFSVYSNQCCVKCNIFIEFHSSRPIQSTVEVAEEYFCIFRKMNNYAISTLLLCHWINNEIVPISGSNTQIVDLDSIPSGDGSFYDGYILWIGDAEGDFIFTITDEKINFLLAFE